MIGQTIGHFRILAKVGEGGMGEVYRGRDSKLNRDVAIKVLLPAVAADAERLARFSREAQVLASISHPNIAQIHGVVEDDSGPLLILEFVDGPTLADRIAQGPLPIDEAVAIAKQIADALEAAHERGVVHRDLKPANIKVDDHGTVKVLDFGLAKIRDQGSGTGDQGSESANSPTITSPAMTQAGVILGTAAYMSPEQAKGRVVDKRTDVWAFGCVLYEMLTGTRAFGGEDVTDTIAAVVRGEPDWTKLPATTPPQIRLLLKRCLEKDRKARIADISVARFLIDEKLAPTEPPARAPSRTPLIAAMAAVIVALIGVSAWMWSSRPAASSPPIVRFEIRPLTGQRVLSSPGGPVLAVAPDGSFVVYRSLHSDESGRQSSVLRLRAWNELEPRAMTDAINARSPFISPDGLWIGYFGPGEIQKIPVAGGPPETICRFAGAPGGASWGDDGTIVFSSSEMDGLQRVPATGGEPVRLTTSEMPKRVRHTMPHYLPGSRFVLFTKFDAARLTWMTQVVEVATGTVKVVLPDAYLPAYSATGHLVYVATLPQSAAGGEIRNSVRAVRFDGARAEVVGEPVTMIDQIPPETAVLGSLGVSRRGDLVYLPDIGGATSRPLRQLVWVDRKGVETAILAPARSYGTARISPDGSRVAVDVRDETNDIWVWDLTRQTFTRVNREESLDSVPIWMPDGNRLVWASTRAGGNPNWYRMAADGTGTAERLTTATRTHFPTSITADGRTVLGFAAGVGSMDLISVTISGPESELKPLIATPASEYGAELSPDGQWIAYHSGESGEDQVYVRPYPNVDGGRWQVSNAGGTRPAWSRDGRELFYLNRDGFLTSVAVLPAAGGQFSAGLPAQILKTAYARGRTTLGLDVRAYDVSPDGRRFLMLTEPPAPPVSTLSPRIVVALNWGEELKARLPAAP